MVLSDIFPAIPPMSDYKVRQCSREQTASFTHSGSPCLRSVTRRTSSGPSLALSATLLLAGTCWTRQRSSQKSGTVSSAKRQVWQRRQSPLNQSQRTIVALGQTPSASVTTVATPVAAKPGSRSSREKKKIQIVEERERHLTSDGRREGLLRRQTVKLESTRILCNKTALAFFKL